MPIDWSESLWKQSKASCNKRHHQNPQTIANVVMVMPPGRVPFYPFCSSSIEGSLVSFGDRVLLGSNSSSSPNSSECKDGTSETDEKDVSDGL